MRILIAALLPLLAPAQASLPREISAVYSYQCVKNYLEGEGVGANSVSCPANQQLGLIEARFTNYLFASRSENNFHEKLEDQAYPSPICGLPITRIDCSASAVQPEFGLSRRPEGIFAISLTISPANGGKTRIYGYAARPNRDGSCPAPLVRALILEAKPESIEYPLPSNFLSPKGELREQIIKIESDELPYYLVHHRFNETPCDSRGSCRNATFGAPFLNQLVPFTQAAGTPVVCVLPRKYIGRL